MRTTFPPVRNNSQPSRFARFLDLPDIAEIKRLSLVLAL
jgi:hypothetical protein